METDIVPTTGVAVDKYTYRTRKRLKTEKESVKEPRQITSTASDTACYVALPMYEEIDYCTTDDAPLNSSDGGM